MTIFIRGLFRQLVERMAIFALGILRRLFVSRRISQLYTDLQLRSLEKKGIVVRTGVDANGETTYEMTPFGRTLLEREASAS